MSQTAPTGITTSPATPDRADRSTFSSRATAWADWLKNQAVPEISAVEQNVYNNAVDAFNNATIAAAQAAIATIIVAQAIAATNVTEWVSGTYIAGDCAYSPITFHTYRCKTTGSRTTDPSLDGANWQILTYNPIKIDPTNKTANYTAVSADMCGQDTSAGSFTVTMPASPVTGDAPVLIHDVNGTFHIYPLILDANGENVYGEADQLRIREKGYIGFAVYCGATIGWKLM